MLKRTLMLLAALTAAPVLPAMASSACTENCVKRMTTDLRGRPPFKRSFEMVPAAEVGQKKVSSRKTFTPRGKPPYKNRAQAPVGQSD